LARPWSTLARVSTAEGPLELRQRGERDFLITIAGRPLMTSTAHRSEDDLALAACRLIASVTPPRPAPHILIGGLGMGFTLRAALDALPAAARVHIAELNPTVAEWCRGPLAILTADALADPRVTLTIGNVSTALSTAAHSAPGTLDAIILDLYEGPHHSREDDQLYGHRALANARTALAPGGVLAVWSEETDATYEQRLKRAQLSFTTTRTASPGGRRHTIYLARR